SFLLLFMFAGCATTPLIHQAIEKGDLNAAREILDKGANISETHESCFWKTDSGNFPYPCTPLMHAATNGNNEIIKALLGKGADINEKVAGYTALSWSASSGKIETVKLLLDRNADISEALAHAEYAGYVNIVKLLIDRGADVNAKGRNWTTAPVLAEAAMTGHIDIVKLLIHSGADVDAALAYFEGAVIKYSQSEYKSGFKLLEKYAKKPELIQPVPISSANVIGTLPPTLIMSDVDNLPTIKTKLNKSSYAIVIGIENYRQKLPKADFAVSDARLVSEYLSKVMGYPEENVVTLINDYATHVDLIKYFEKWLPNNVENNSTVFIYYSGHGAPNSKTGDAYLVPYDGDPSFIDQTGYSLKRMYDALGKLPAKEIVVALDSCFSGAGGRSVIAKGARPLVMNLQDNMVLPKNMTVLSASSGEQISSTYDEKGHGLFTYFLLKGIKNEDVLKQDGTIAISDLFSYLKPQVERIARKQYNNEQTPQLIGAKKD
ncbi:MAG: hypothetical protein QG578_842, partial [Thermodesulfobacteriota bacterium]|nr:hypothetical protein [Thermodesulfobacteriota bacterium]